MKITKDARKAKLLTEEFACRTWKVENTKKFAIFPTLQARHENGKLRSLSAPQHPTSWSTSKVVSKGNNELYKVTFGSHGVTLEVTLEVEAELQKVTFEVTGQLSKLLCKLLGWFWKLLQKAGRNLKK